MAVDPAPGAPLPEKSFAPGPVRGRRLAFLLPDLNGGGVQRMVSNLARALAGRGAEIELVVCQPSGRLTEELPPEIRVVSLERAGWASARLAAIRADPAGARLLLWPMLHRKARWKSLAHLPALARYLRDTRLDAFFAATPYLNLAAVLARRLAGADTRLILSERSYFSAGKVRKVQRARHLAPALARAYPQADAVSAVSHGLAEDLERALGIPREQVVVLHNPVVTPDFEERLAAPVEHPWFAPGERSVILSVGRLGPQKDHPTLIRAFARVRSQRDVRLVILGDPAHGAKGERSRQALYELADSLGVREHVDLPGYAPNPLPYMARCALFVLSSRFEGFPNVLVEALGAGAPVVSTDCPVGPQEILDGGRYGLLTPVGDDTELAGAMLKSLDNPPAPERQRARARIYSFEASIDGYQRLLLGD